ncbi:hypothetical protein KJ570_03265 [Patescibacteria group bacterium]|nr:hypothetical protein [Patescibacteria group bacterium]
MQKKIKDLLLILAISIVPTLFIWIPFFLRLDSFWSIPLPLDGMASIVSNYDGPLYIIIAKTFYNLDLFKNFSVDLPAQYYAAHFPLFPILIRMFSFLLGYPYSMLFVTILSSFLSFFFFFKLALNYVDRKSALWLTMVFGIMPARWLIVRSVGSAEPLFIASIIASIYYFNKKKYLISGIFGFLAQLTKSPAIILFLAYLLYIVVPHIKDIATMKFSDWFKKIEFTKKIWIFLIPMSLLLIFTLYSFTFKDFFAYFHSGDNIHIFFPPFSIFNYSASWVGTFWLEEIIFVYLFGALALTNLIKSEKTVITWFFATFFISTLFISHRDLIRYSLPIVPFLIISFRETLLKKEFKYILLFLSIPIYLFSLAYISQNIMPIGNWAPFL